MDLAMIIQASKDGNDTINKLTSSNNSNYRPDNKKKRECLQVQSKESKRIRKINIKGENSGRVGRKAQAVL